MPELAPPRFRPLPLGSIRPTGWLRNQLRIQAAGLSGHLDEFWPDVQRSRWFGGDADGWERGPYWLDGFLPLAFLLDDPALTARAVARIDQILALQGEDGWLGPREEHRAGIASAGRYDLWPQFVGLKILIQHHEATGDARAVAAIENALRRIDRHIDSHPLFDWAMFRWFEALIPILWLHEKTGEAWLLDLALKLRSQGFDYAAFLERWPYTQPDAKGRWSFMSHVVNNAMAIKASALWSRITGDERDRAASSRMIELLDQHHGAVTGVFTGDECIAGQSPVHGTELCGVVEYMFSLEILLSVLGDAAFGDRLERIAFNALPATFSPDMWAHQYNQQVNQVQCSITERDKVPWQTNGPEANIFGLEPNYGCCTANLSQGWPKFAAHLWMQDDDGVAAVAYAPSIASANIRGVKVEIQLDTEYPFREALRFAVRPERPVAFSLRLRIPAWAAGARVQVSGQAESVARGGGFHSIDREWRGETVVLLTLPMQPRAARRFHNALAIERGPLVYSLRMGEDWRRVNADKPGREPPHADWEVYPTTPWNYALDADENSIAGMDFVEHPVGSCPFSPEGAPVVAAVKGRRLPQWQMKNNSADETPPSPVESSEPLEDLVLIPYGCTNLRVTEFPTLR